MLLGYCNFKIPLLQFTALSLPGSAAGLLTGWHVPHLCGPQAYVPSTRAPATQNTSTLPQCADPGEPPASGLTALGLPGSAAVLLTGWHALPPLGCHPIVDSWCYFLSLRHPVEEFTDCICMWECWPYVFLQQLQAFWSNCRSSIHFYLTFVQGQRQGPTFIPLHVDIQLLSTICYKAVFSPMHVLGTFSRLGWLSVWAWLYVFSSLGLCVCLHASTRQSGYHRSVVWFEVRCWDASLAILAQNCFGDSWPFIFPY